MNRKKFIKRSLMLTTGAFLISPIAKYYGETSAKQPAMKPEPNKWKDDEISISWIGHSTVLINFFGKIILTDPVLFSRVGIYILGTNFGPERFTAPALTFEEMPKPDLILLSHAHMDHMDYLTLDHFASEYPKQIDVITAYNTMDVIENLKWKSIREMDWGHITESNGIKLSALQVKHFGWRFPWERDRSKGFFDNGRSYNAYILERNGVKILFGGDTANTDLFKKTGEKVDIAIMPIGAYHPWKMNHCNPEEALQMAKELEAKVFIPIHTNTFKQGLEPREEPLEWISNSFSKYDLQLGIKQIGETFQTA
jgi:L-ascorbate metabolism protein UlaG (beta-lactamase superfamily)